MRYRDNKEFKSIAEALTWADPRPELENAR